MHHALTIWRSVFAASLLATVSLSVSHAEEQVEQVAVNAESTDALKSAAVNNYSQNIPCPPFWMVQPNPSMDNSLSYVHESGSIAVSVTYIADKSGSQVSAETFSRVAAEQMNCTLPVRSNILKKAWAFNCDDDIEALVYGEPGNLVLLSISGRNDDTESYFESFISFLSYQASSR